MSDGQHIQPADGVEGWPLATFERMDVGVHLALVHSPQMLFRVIQKTPFRIAIERVNSYPEIQGYSPARFDDMQFRVVARHEGFSSFTR